MHKKLWIYTYLYTYIFVYKYIYIYIYIYVQGAAPPVNPSGLSGFRTAGATGEEEEEYGQDDFAVDAFDT
jgi:hypothetical protein